MKFLEMPELSRLAQALSHEGPECSVLTRIEAYSCKNVKRDKKLFKSLEMTYREEASNSPPLPSFLADLDLGTEMTPFGPIDSQSARKTLYLLIATLNVAFPDYEFSDVRPAHFNKEESGASVLNALSNTLISPHRAGRNVPRTYSSYPPTSANFFPNSVPTSSSPLSDVTSTSFGAPQILSGTHPTLYRILDNAIRLSECEVYSYEPDIESDPHADDVDEDEDEVNSEDDHESSSEEEIFEFDDYDIDEHSSKPKRPSWSSSGSSELEGSQILSHITRMKRRGALLWSSHWFFLNRKLKRILFVSVWARSKSPRLWVDDEFSAEPFSMATGKSSSERFLGWEGAVGAGARAMGLII
jgi:hypothetical protein